MVAAWIRPHDRGFTAQARVSDAKCGATTILESPLNLHGGIRGRRSCKVRYIREKPAELLVIVRIAVVEKVFFVSRHSAHLRTLRFEVWLETTESGPTDAHFTAPKAAKQLMCRIACLASAAPRR